MLGKARVKALRLFFALKKRPCKQSPRGIFGYLDLSDLDSWHMDKGDTGRHRHARRGPCCTHSTMSLATSSPLLRSRQPCCLARRAPAAARRAALVRAVAKPEVLDERKLQMGTVCIGTFISGPPDGYVGEDAFAARAEPIKANWLAPEVRKFLDDDGRPPCRCPAHRSARKELGRPHAELLNAPMGTNGGVGPAPHAHVFHTGPGCS